MPRTNGGYARGSEKGMDSVFSKWGEAGRLYIKVYEPSLVECTNLKLSGEHRASHRDLEGKSLKLLEEKDMNELF